MGFSCYGHLFPAEQPRHLQLRFTITHRAPHFHDRADSRLRGKGNGGGRASRGPVSRILYLARGEAAAIYLVPPLPEGIVRPTRGLQPGAALRRAETSPYLALLRVGFASIPACAGTWCALTAPFHACLSLRVRAIGAIVSVALSVASLRLGVTQHPARRSPDFPPRRCRSGRPALLTCSVYAAGASCLRRNNERPREMFRLRCATLNMTRPPHHPTGVPSP